LTGVRAHLRRRFAPCSSCFAYTAFNSAIIASELIRIGLSADRMRLQQVSYSSGFAGWPARLRARRHHSGSKRR
jgi:hypothetical protein